MQDEQKVEKDSLREGIVANFSKAQRLITKHQYARVFDKPKKVYMSEFLLLVRDVGENKARLGLAISKKTIAKASGRNRVKRLIRESFRQTDLSHIDVVALSRRGLNDLSNDVLRRKLSKAWEKVNALYES